MSNDRFSSLAPNKLSKDNKKNLDTTIQKETNFKKEIEVEVKDKKLNMFKKKPQNTRFNFNHENNDDRNEERDRLRIHFNIIKIMIIEMMNEIERIHFNIIKIMIIHFEKREEIIIAEKVILTDENI